MYKAIAAEAKRLGLPLAGHVPISLSATEVSAAGQKSIEHLGNVLGGGLLVDCSTDEAALRAKLREGVMKLDEQVLDKHAPRPDRYSGGETPLESSVAKKTRVAANRVRDTEYIANGFGEDPRTRLATGIGLRRNLRKIALTILLAGC